MSHLDVEGNGHSKGKSVKFNTPPEREKPSRSEDRQESFSMDNFNSRKYSTGIFSSNSVIISDAQSSHCFEPLPYFDKLLFDEAYGRLKSNALLIESVCGFFHAICWFKTVAILVSTWIRLRWPSEFFCQKCRWLWPWRRQWRANTTSSIPISTKSSSSMARLSGKSSELTKSSNLFTGHLPSSPDARLLESVLPQRSELRQIVR